MKLSGCIGPLLPRVGSPQLQRVGATLYLWCTSVSLCWLLIAQHKL